jgi:hypothetical protein
MVAMTTHGHMLQELPLVKVDLADETGIAREAARHKAQRQSVFLSPVLPLRPTSLDNKYGAQCIFTVPKSYINNQLTFFLFVRDENTAGLEKHQLPSTVIAYTEIADDHLKSSLQ